MKSATGWTVFALFVLGMLGLAYNAWREHEPGPAPVVQPAVGPAAPPAPIGPPEANAPAHYPIEAAAAEGAPDAADVLPALDQSDAAVGDALGALFGSRPLRDVLVLNGFIRRIVATVDALPRDTLAQRLSPVAPAPGRFLVADGPDGLVMSPDNAARYTPYVALAEAVDSAALVAAYVRLYPLFQQAYIELGYPSGYFNDRLVQVIDHLLATPRVSGPVRLVQPRVVYRFADPALARLSAGQQIMVRMGEANAARVKNKLADIRGLLVGRRGELAREGAVR